MEYNYYPVQAGHPPLPLGPNQQPLMMHPSSGHTQNVRQSVTPGTPGPQIMMQPQGPPQQPPPPSQSQMIGQHMQPMLPQQHQNFHQMPPLPHSASPHPQNHLNHQPASLQPPPRPSTGPSPQHPMHQQSPHNLGGPMQSPQLNHINGPPPPQLLPPNHPNHQQPGMQHQPPLPPPTINHQQSGHYMGPGNPGGGPMPPIPNHHYSPHTNLPPPPQPPLSHNHPPPPHFHYHGAQPPPSMYPPHVQQHMDRVSPFYQNIPPTEFRIIELNKRLQNRPTSRLPESPLPSDDPRDSYWWEKFTSDFFDDDSTLSLRVPLDGKQVEFTVGRTLIPRFWKNYFDGGVVDLSIKLRNPKEIPRSPHIMTLECDQTDMTTKNIFRHQNTSMLMNVVVHTEGHLSLEFVSNNFDNLLIKSWRFYIRHSHEYIDRSMTISGLPSATLIDPVTKSGLTSRTLSYLRMCSIIEPMKVLMVHQKQTNLNAHECLKNLLFERQGFKSDDTRAQPNKRRKRKAPAATGSTTTGGSRKSKANQNNTNLNNNHLNYNNNNNIISSPLTTGGLPNLSLASQDVMTVGEPSMLSSDFGDENARCITRLENDQFDPSNNNNNNSNQNQMMINNSNQNQQQNSINHVPHTPNNHENNGSGVSIMNNTNNNGISDIGNPNNGNNCIQSNNNHQMNLISMNGNVNHVSHIVKTEIDLKHTTSNAPTTADTEAM